MVPERRWVGGWGKYGMGIKEYTYHDEKIKIIKK